jgi:DNA-binding NarL/FixJ family response regulator
MEVQRALQAGACGYVTRRDPVAALSGEQYVGPLVERTLPKNLSSGAVEMRGSEVSALSNRELQVFRLIGRGLPTREVAEELSVSVKTIETHRQRIKEKLHVTSGAELQRRAVLFHGTTED